MDERDIKAKGLGAIKKIEVEGDNGEVKVAYFKQPHRYVLGLAYAKIEINPVEANEMVLKNCIIEEVSDMEILTNDSYFFGAMQHVASLMEVKKSKSSSL